MDGDWEQCVVQLVQKLLDAAVMYSVEGRLPQGDVNNSCIVGDARPPVERSDIPDCTAGVGPLGETPGV